MKLDNIFDTLLYGTFRCDNCGRPHPWMQNIWKSSLFPNYKFGSKKCMKEYVRDNRKR